MTDNPIDRMYSALSQGDIATMRGCFMQDAKIWHCFDGIAQDIEAAVQGWQGLIAYTKERHIEDVRRQMTQAGFVQQHIFVLRTVNGERKAWPVCLVVTTHENRIARVDEYIDRAGSFTPPDGPIQSPGF